MTDEQRIARVKSYFDANTEGLTDEVVADYLADAKDWMLVNLYPHKQTFPEDAEVPLRYEGMWCEKAARMFSRRGGLGEVAHIENGIHRNWASSDDSDLLRNIIPFASVR